MYDHLERSQLRAVSVNAQIYGALTTASDHCSIISRMFNFDCIYIDLESCLTSQSGYFGCGKFMSV